jgi:WXG100 family type VII secretion target
MAGSISSISVDTTTIENGYADFGNILEFLVDTLRGLDKQLAVSLSEWSGPAREAYDVARAEWWQAAADLTGTLAWLRGVLSVAQANYEQCEDSIVRACAQE